MCISEVREIETFTTWFNGNCGYVIDSSFRVWLVICEPKYKEISEKLWAEIYLTSNDTKNDLSRARSGAQRLKEILQRDDLNVYPMSEINPLANKYEKCGSLILNPYMIVEKIDWNKSNYYVLDNHFKPLDIVWVNCGSYNHAGIYLGDVGGSDRICHFSKSSNGVRLVSWERFVEGSKKEIMRYHSLLPFKHHKKIARQIAWAYSNNFWEDQYDLRNRNCEHFANMCVYGINYSWQVYEIFGVMDVAGANLFSSALPWPFPAIVESPLSRVREDANKVRNNFKGSEIKLTNEIRECDEILKERDNWLYEKITANIEIPAKENCSIM